MKTEDNTGYIHRMYIYVYTHVHIYMCACVCLCVLHIYAYMFLFYYARICEYACVIREYESICVLDTSFSKA